MKLRYYLRGLGIGVLVTAFVMGIISSPRRDMSDAEIRARAAELGMIDPNSQVLSNLSQSSTEPTGTMPEDGGNDRQTEPEQSLDDDPEPDSKTWGGNPQNDNDTDVSGSEDLQADLFSNKTDGSDEPDGVDEPDESESLPEEPSVETVRFTIRGGSGSESVCSDLAAAGLVESAAAYDAFLCDNGYSQRLRSGTFDIPVGASYEEIARMITGG